MGRALLPVLLLAALAAPPAAGQDFRSARGAFEEAFRPDRPAPERESAVAGLTAFDDRETVKLLLGGIPVSDRILDGLLLRRKEVDAEITKLEQGQMFEGQRTHTADVAKRLKDLKRESGSLRDAIDAELAVLALIETSLGSFRSEAAIAHLAGPALDDKLPRTREMAAAALGGTDSPAVVKPLVKALRDTIDRVRMAAAVSLGRLRAAEAVDELLKLLADREPWPVRGAAIEALGEIGERRAVGPLVERIGKEEGRLQLDCGNALSKLTGENFGAVPEAWKRWWEEHRAEFEKGDAEPAGGGGGPAPGATDGGYYGIPVQTDRAVFILDVSGSMSKSSKDPGRDPADGETSKIDSAKNELARVVREFSPRGRFNLIVFNDVVKKWKETMVPASPAMKAEAQSFVSGLSAASSTNIYDAMAAAFELAGMGARDKYYDLGADTIFLLSDGSPTKSDGSLDDWEKVLKAVAEWNRLKRVVIHAIGVGGHNVAFMSRLASENGGRYVAR